MENHTALYCEVTVLYKKFARSNVRDLWISVGVICGAFLLTHLITAVVMLVFQPNTSVMISGTMLPFLAGLILFIFSFYKFVVVFPNALQFSITRKRAFSLVLGHLSLLALLTTGLAGLLTWLECTFAPLFWKVLTGAQALELGTGGRSVPPPPKSGFVPPVESLPELSSLYVVLMELDWWWFPVIALGGIALGLIVGAILQRYGTKGLWLLWGIWMAITLSPRFSFWDNLFHPLWVFPLELVLTAVMGLALIWSVWSLLHAVIRT